LQRLKERVGEKEWAALVLAAQSVQDKPEPEPKVSVFDNGDSYIEALRKRGFVYLGRGAYSAVLCHPSKPDRVIKVCRGLDDWPIYAAYVSTLKTPYAIKVFSIKKRANFYVAVMERLEFIANDVRYSSAKDGHYREAAECIDFFKYRTPSFKPGTTFDTVADAARAKYAEKRYPGMAAFIRLLKRTGMCNDLHHGNYGFRADGSIAVFDPVTEMHNYKIKSRFSSSRFKRAA
jgi:hypothetical protein